MILTPPRVSVVIPTYNRSAFVGRAVKSVLSQTATDYEIIVVDDGSTDSTKESIREFRPRIRYIYQDNSGVSAARNTGIKAAQGEWVTFLDSDDEWKSDYLVKQIEHACAFPRVIMQAANCRFYGLDGATISYFDLNRSLPEFKGNCYMFIEKPFRFLVKHGPWQVGSTMFRRKAIIEAGLFDSRFNISEDFDLMARVALLGPFGMIREELVNIFRRHEQAECLTNQVKKNPMQTTEANGNIYEKLRDLDCVNDEDRRTLDRLLSANRRGMGNLYLESGNVKAARVCYRRALLLDASIASLGRYVLSFLPRRIHMGATKGV